VARTSRYSGRYRPACLISQIGGGLSVSPFKTLMIFRRVSLTLVFPIKKQRYFKRFLFLRVCFYQGLKSIHTRHQLSRLLLASGIENIPESHAVWIIQKDGMIPNGSDMLRWAPICGQAVNFERARQICPQTQQTALGRTSRNPNCGKPTMFSLALPSAGPLALRCPVFSTGSGK